MLLSNHSLLYMKVSPYPKKNILCYFTVVCWNCSILWYGKLIIFDNFSGSLRCMSELFCRNLKMSVLCSELFQNHRIKMQYVFEIEVLYKNHYQILSKWPNLNLKWIKLCNSDWLIKKWRQLRVLTVANYPDEVISKLPDSLETGVYYGFASIDGDEVYKMVLSVGWNPFFKNTKKSMVGDLSKFEASNSIS